MRLRPEVAFDGRSVHVAADLRRYAVPSAVTRRLGGVHGLVELPRTVRRGGAADAVLLGEAPVLLSAGELPDGRALRFELRATVPYAKRTE